MTVDWSTAPCRGRVEEFVFVTRQTSDPVKSSQRRRKIAAAKAVCATCPLRTECLERELDVMADGLPSMGVFGGTTESERRQLVERRPPHGSDRGYHAHKERGDEPCDECRRAHNRSQAAWKANNRERVNREARERRWMVAGFAWFAGLKVAALAESWRLRMETT